MEGEGDKNFDILYFDFMLVGTKMVGEKMRDNPRNESLG